MSKDKNKKNDDKQTKYKMIYKLNIKKKNFKIKRCTKLQICHCYNDRYNEETGKGITYFLFLQLMVLINYYGYSK